MTGAKRKLGMKILVAIANYGTKNDGYLQQLLTAYRAIPYEVHVAVLTNLPKDLGPDVEVIVGLPGRDPWSLPFAHKKLFAERQNDFDLFVYSEDDTPLHKENIDAFLDATSLLPENEIAGFLRYEKDAQGKRYFSTVHSHFHWDPASVHQCGGETFAYFTNEHAACFVLTANQLKKAIQSGGFLVEPHSSRYDLLCSAATDPYTQCGFRKMICISKLDDFVIPHLPNKYIGKMGLPEELMTVQVRKLLQPETIRQEVGFGFPLYTKLPQAMWSKSYYEPASKALLDLVPGSARRILSIGSGSGELESALVEGGKQVSSLPLDDVIGECTKSRGVEVIGTDFAHLVSFLGDTQFDCVVVSNILHLVPDPTAFLKVLPNLVVKDGSVIVRVPNTEKFSARILRWRQGNGHRNLGDFEKAGVQQTGPTRLRRWLREAGLRVATLRTISSERMDLPRKLTLGLADGLLGTELLAEAKKSVASKRGILNSFHV
jgi:2-polyprenyl-3-methyl-5-hydroxy-6-metoxy-1,4-benzoquinol methylase